MKMKEIGSIKCDNMNLIFTIQNRKKKYRSGTTWPLDIDKDSIT